MANARGAALWVAAAASYLILEALAAAGYEPAYSYARDYISDLGVDVGSVVHGRMTGSPRSYLMHTAFYLQGILFFLGALVIVGIPESVRARIFLGLVAMNSIGNVAIGSAHIGTVHRIGAALAIVGGNAAILAGSAVIATVMRCRWYRRISALVAALGLLSLVMLTVNSATSRTILLADGAWERGSVYTIIAWQLLTGACLLGFGRKASATRHGPEELR